MQGLVEAIKVTLEDPFSHRGGCPARLWSLRADGRRATGLVGIWEALSWVWADSRVGRGSRRASTALEIVELGLGETSATQ